MRRDRGEGPHSAYRFGAAARTLIGREAEIAVARDMLVGTRLLTLVGPGGVGKTALATVIAKELGATPRTVPILDLRETTDASTLAGEVASAIGASEPADDPPEQRLARAIPEGAGRLVVLDNLEQVNDCGNALARLLVAAPGLSVIATSRRPLGNEMEVVLAVPPLALPESPTTANALDAPACRLFIERARQHGWTTPLDRATAMDVADLCQRLDGLPLALELAAGRTRLLEPGAIVRRLGPGNRDLLTRPGDSGRHRSLDAVLDLSLQLLRDEERRLLLAVSVFAGSFDLNMAAGVSPRMDTLAALEVLVDAQLLRHEQQLEGEPEFRLLETIRASARRRLSAARLTQLRHRHLETLLLAVRAEREPLLSADRAHSVRRLAGRLEDIRAAFDFALDLNPGAAIELIAPTWRFWVAGGRAQEASERLRRALMRENSATPARAWGFAALAGLAHMKEGNAAAQAPAVEAIRIARRVGDAAAELEALPGASLAAIATGNPALAIRLSRRAVLLSRRTGDVRAHVRALATLGMAYGGLGQPHNAAKHLIQAVREAHNSGDPFNEGIQLSNLAQLELEEDRPRQALEHAAASAIILRKVDQGWYLAMALTIEAEAHVALGRLEEGRLRLGEAARLVRDLRLPGATSELLARSVRYLIRVGEPGLATRALQAARLHHATSGQPTQPRYLQEAELGVATLLPPNSDPDLATLANPVEVEPQGVLDELVALLDGTGSSGFRTQGPGSLLTPREVEVARLLGRGFTDRQIADELEISQKTASVHVSNIKGKLGVESRIEAAMVTRLLDFTQTRVRADA